LQLVPEPAPLRPDPPATLSVEEAEEWRNVVANMAPGWFRKEYRGILVAYCQQVVVGGFFAAKAAEVADKEGVGLELYIKLTKAAERANRAADKFGTTLRITPQSRYDAHKAARDSNKTQATRPW
jgi:hypothetical protein